MALHTQLPIYRTGLALLSLAHSVQEQMPLTPEYVAKHKPEVGGYYVVYEDGYKSFSPASAFESGYTRL